MKKTNITLKLLFTLVFLLGLFFIAGKVQAGNITLNHLDYEATLNEDGSMNVVENWDARIRDTNTMFKDFTLDNSKFKEITNVEVYRVSGNNTKTKLTQINEEMYHVTEDCYYGLVASDGDFEIAWGVSVDGVETREYEIHYTVVDAVKTYQDCSELYWQFLNATNSIPATRVTGAIYLPQAVQDKNNVRAWAHGPYNGNIEVQADKVTFELNYLEPGVMLEVRVAVLENLFPENTTIATNRFNTILQEEQQWADEANAEREEYIKEKEREERWESIMDILAIIAKIALCIFFIYRLIYNCIKAGKLPKKPVPPLIDYYRDIPDQKASAGDAAFLYYFKKGAFPMNISKVLSATLLELSLKKYIAFSVDNTAKKPEVRINILDYSDHIEQMPALKKDEQIVYQLLMKVSEQKTFTMKEFQEYAKKNTVSFAKEMDKIKEEVGKEQERLENYVKTSQSKASDHVVYGIMYILFGFPIIFSWSVLLGITLILNCIPHFVMNSKLNTLTQKGTEEAAKWNGLKRYMEDFSLLNEKEVPDLAVWEKYLVFATAFGISEKVLKQLKIRYPELQQINGYEYSYMNLLYYSTLNTAFLSSLNNATNQVYMGGMSSRASSGYSGGNFSSGGGFGGGFSGGGGFGGGGGRNGRKIIAPIHTRFARLGAYTAYTFAIYRV